MLAQFGSGHASVNMYLRLCVHINCVCLCVIFLIFTCYYSHPTSSSQVCRKSFPLDTFDLKRDIRWAANFTAHEFTILNFYSDFGSNLRDSIVPDTWVCKNVSQWNCYMSLRQTDFRESVVKGIVNSMKSCHDWFHPHVIPNPHYFFSCRVQKEMFSSMFMLFLSMQWKRTSLKWLNMNLTLWSFLNANFYQRNVNWMSNIL